MEPKTILNQYARTAGILYLLIAPLGFFGLLYVDTFLNVPGDLEATLLNIQTEAFSYRLSILAALLVQVIQLFIAFFLYQLFKSVHRTWALFIMLFTVVSIPIAMLNEVSRVAVLYFIGASDYSMLINSEQAPSMVNLLLNLNRDGMLIAHLFFSLWLLPMGVLILKSGFVPKFIGWLMILAFLGYLIDTFIWILVPNSTFEASVYTFWGEIILPLWLVIKGVNTKQYA